MTNSREDALLRAIRSGYVGMDVREELEKAVRVYVAVCDIIEGRRSELGEYLDQQIRARSSVG